MIAKGLALVIIIVLCLYAVFLYTRPVSNDISKQTERVRLSPAPQAETRLYFSPSLLRLGDLSEHELMIFLETGKNKLTSAQLELKYDPQKVIITTIRPGTLFSRATTPVTNPIQRYGRVEFALTLPDTLQPISGSGELAILTIRRNPAASASAETTVTFLPKTSVRGPEATASLLKTAANARIELEALPPALPSLQP